jgi:hypothetical protein
MPLPLIGLAIGAIGAGGRMIARGKANKDLKRLMGQDPTYKENPLAKQRLGLASALLNARMPGSVQAERNIFANQANQVSNINRNATDSSQALALATGTQGQTNDAISDLGMAEAQDYQRRYGNYSNAQDGVIQEQDKVFQDGVRRFENKVGMQGKINENRQNSWGEIANLGFGIANMGMSGGMDGMFGGGNKFNPTMSNATRASALGASNPLIRPN